MAQDGEVLGGVLGSHPALVFVKGHVKHPVQTVFNAPMGADIGEHLLGGQILHAGDVVPGFGAGFALNFAAGAHYDEGRDPAPHGGIFGGAGARSQSSSRGGSSVSGWA